MLRYSVLLLFLGVFGLFEKTIADTTPVTAYQVCFTPGENCTAKIIGTIQQAKSNIFVQAYSFTSTPIANALVEAKNRGVDVQILLDKSQKTHASYAVKKLIHEGVPIKVDFKPIIAHNKTMIIDGSTVISGSFNFTYAAQHDNAENVLIIENPALAKAYLKNWWSRERESTVLQTLKSGH